MEFNTKRVEQWNQRRYWIHFAISIYRMHKEFTYTTFKETEFEPTFEDMNQGDSQTIDSSIE